MKVLLVGEYSRLHNSLKEGLEKLGHEVFIIGIGADKFKNYPVNIDIDSKFFNLKVPFFLKRVFYRLTRIDLCSIEIAIRFLCNFYLFKGFDVVQLINEKTLRTQPRIEVYLLNKLKKHNKKLFMLSCSVDSINLDYALKEKFKYSVITPLLEKPNDIDVKKSYVNYHDLRKKDYQKIIDFLNKNIGGIIASDMDYHLPLIGHEKYLGLIPNPINTDLIPAIPFIHSGKIKIFHAINERMILQKGNSFFTEALEIISKRHADKVEIATVKNVLYSTYINLYNDCHILLDQVYSYDQGYNALEAMSKGKVVFTGAETEFLNFYNLKKNQVCINAEPNVESIVRELEDLILHPAKLEEISNNAINFVREEHHYIKIAEKYIKAWS